MNERADGELVAMARSGDKDAFGQLVERHQRMAERIAAGFAGQGDLARELAQEAMLQAYLSMDRLRNPDSFQSWLYGIVLNVCRSAIRERRASFSLEALEGGMRFEALPFFSAEPGPQEAAEAQELRQVVLSAVSALSPRTRAATLLFYYEQLSLREIAAVLGISVVAVKGRLHKARSQLRERLLPLYAEMSQGEQRRRPMVRVTIADVIARERKDEATGRTFAQYTIILHDEERHRILPIWVGPAEGEAIAIGLGNSQLPRPLTYDFIANMLGAAGAELEEVRIDSIRENTYYAIARLRRGDTIREVDARPSDVMGLAVRTGSPIYVADDVMEQASLDIPEDMIGKEPSGNGLNTIMNEIEERAAAMAQSYKSTPRPTEEEIQRMRQQMWESLFGAEA